MPGIDAQATAQCEITALTIVQAVFGQRQVVKHLGIVVVADRRLAAQLHATRIAHQHASKSVKRGIAILEIVVETGLFVQRAEINQGARIVLVADTLYTDSKILMQPGLNGLPARIPPFGHTPPNVCYGIPAAACAVTPPLRSTGYYWRGEYPDCLKTQVLPATRCRSPGMSRKKACAAGHAGTA
jgi:hypothetical protein